MIVDCHAHVFENWHGACGHASRAVHLKYLQKVVTRPAARAFRVRDGKEVKPTMLFRPADNTWAVRYGDPEWKQFLDMWATFLSVNGEMERLFKHHMEKLGAA